MSVITNSLAMMDTSSAVTSLDADAVVYDNTTSGLSATDAQAAIDELKSDINNISTPDADDVSFTAPSTSGHSTYGANTDTVQEALNDINDAMRSVIDYGDIGYYVKGVSAISVTYNACGGFWSGTSVSDAEAGLNYIGEYLNNFSPSANADDIYFSNPLDSIYSSNTDNVQEALEDINTVVQGLDTEDIALPSASKTGIYANADDVQDALDAIKTALASGGGGGSVDASDVTFDSEASCWGGACAGSVEEALFDLNDRIEALSGGGSGASTAAGVSFTKPQNSIYGANTDTVQEALEDVNTSISNLNARDIVLSPPIPGEGWGRNLLQDASTVEQGLYEINEFIGVITTCDGINVPYTKPQNSIYGANTDTVKEALDDVSTVIQALDSTDIAIPAASKTGIYANTATVQAALDAIKTAISSGGGGGGSSSASSVSFTKPQGGIYSSGTDTVQEALEDVSAKIIYLNASDIGYLGSGCGGGYPSDVETVKDALDALEHLLYKYSEYEAETGWLWFNDKPIYQVSVEEIESGTTNLFDTNELEIDDLVYMEATLTDSSGTKRWTISGSSGDFYWNTATHMIVYGGSDVITTATIRYTKTSD